jgi:RND family efflux transporter MFP subunit
MERNMPDTRTAAVPARRVLAIALAAVALASCKKEEKNAFVPPPPPDVVVAAPVERDVVRYITYTGTIEAFEYVELRARVQGFLEKINYEAGQKVKKGDVLFVIDKSQYQADADRAEADLHGAEAAVNGAVAAVDTAIAEVEVQEALLVGAENDAKLARTLADQKAGPEIDAIIKAAMRDAKKAQLAKAKFEVANARTNVENAKTDVERAKAIVVAARLNLGYCDVVAPIDGRVSVNKVDVGNLVGRGEPTLLAEIVQSAPVYVSVDVSESDVLAIRRDNEKQGRPAGTEPGRVKEGEWRPAELALADQEEFKAKGHVDYVDPQMNAATGTLRVRTVYANEDASLVPGFFARVRFPMSSAKSFLVPDAALLTDQQGRFALVVNAENTVEARRVKVGILEKDLRVVEEGLKADDRVVVLGVLKARPGSKVTPMTEAEAKQKAEAQPKPAPKESSKEPSKDKPAEGR